MRIYGKEEFLKLPEGTIFSYYEPINTEGLYIKYSTFGNDFVLVSLLDSFDLGEADDIYDIQEELESGGEISFDYDMGAREGLFDDAKLYLVYSKKDVKALVSLLNKMGEI